MSIQSFACSDTESLFTTGKCRRFVNIKSVAERKLAQLDAAPSVSFMKAPPGNDLKEYEGAWHVELPFDFRIPTVEQNMAIPEVKDEADCEGEIHR
jgi:proteic killer suppression protein